MSVKLNASLSRAFCGCGIGELIIRGINLLSQVVPDVFRHGQKGLDDVGIELGSGASLDFLAGRFHGLPGTIWPVGCDGIQRVRHREYASAQRDLSSSQPPGIAAAVIILLVSVNNLGSLLQERNIFQNLVTTVAMLA